MPPPQMIAYKNGTGRLPHFSSSRQPQALFPDDLAPFDRRDCKRSFSVGSVRPDTMSGRLFHQDQRIVVLPTLSGANDLDRQSGRTGRGEDVDSCGFHRRSGLIGMLACCDPTPLLLRDHARLTQPARPAYEGERFVVARQEDRAFQCPRDVPHRLPVVAVHPGGREHLPSGGRWPTSRTQRPYPTRPRSPRGDCTWRSARCGRPSPS